MKRALLSLVAAISLVGSTGTHAEPSEFDYERPLVTKEQQKAALETVLSELATHYGMLRFKKQYYGITLQNLRQKYSQLIDRAETLEEHLGLRAQPLRAALPPDEARQLLIGLAAEYQDGHFNIRKPGISADTLGINVAAIDGKLYVTGTHPDFYIKYGAEKDLQKGDEVIEVDGEAVAQIALRKLPYVQRATWATRWGTALEFIIQPSPFYLRPIAEGQRTKITFKRGSETFVGNFQWVNRKFYADDKIYFPDRFTFNDNQINKRDFRPYVFATSSGVRTYFREGLEKRLPSEAVLDLNPTVSQSLGWANPMTRLQAYVLRVEGKSIGVLRIPDYSTGGAEQANELAWIAKAVAYLQTQSDVLVLDLLQNGGGSNAYAGTFLKFFATEPIPAELIDIKLSRTLLNNFFGDSEENLRARNYAQRQLDKDVQDKWRDRLENGDGWTGLIPEKGDARTLAENEPGVRTAYQGTIYDKPILVLNDAHSGSNGDMVPSMLQKAKRVLVMGETSMGLGGMVYRSQESLPGSELTMRCTAGVCFNADGSPIENVGVVPDIRRDVMLSDLKDNFEAYSDEVLKTALALANGQASASELQAIADTARNAQLKAEISKLPSLRAKNLSDLQEALDHGPEVALLRASSDPNQVPVSLRATSEALFEILKSNGAGAFSPTISRSLVVPLPTYLTSKDPMLASLVKPDEVRERLKEMLRREIFSSSFDQDLIRLWIDKVNAAGDLRYSVAQKAAG